MELVWLLQGAAGLIGPMQSWLRDPRPACPGSDRWRRVVIVLAIAMLSRRRRQRAARMQAERVRDEAAFLKDQLRQRLSEPASLLAGGINAAPTMGASEAFEGDIEAAAQTVLVEAGGHRAKAKTAPAPAHERPWRGQRQAQRQRGGLLAPARRAFPARRHLRRAGGLCQGGGPGARECRGADAGGRSPSARGQSRRSRGCVPAPNQARRCRQRQHGCRPARYRGHTMLGDVLAAREDHEEAMAAYAEAQREVKALLERDAEHAGLQARSVRHLRPHRRHACGQGRARCGARELSPEPRDRRGAGRARSAERRSGSTICPSATTASATCWTRRATARLRSRASARAWRSPRRWRARTRQRAMAMGPLRQPRPHRRCR